MSVFREGIMFLDSIGIYDVVLPLLLIFSIVYAILEKTQIFGKEKVGDKEYTRKNINAMVAFVSGFFFVASAQLVGTVHKLVADVSLVIVAFVLFMILIGVFQKDGANPLEGGWKKIFMVIAFVSLALILLNALGWLELLWFVVAGGWNPSIVASVALLFLMAVIIYFIIRTPPDNK